MQKTAFQHIFNQFSRYLFASSARFPTLAPFMINSNASNASSPAVVVGSIAFDTIHTPKNRKPMLLGGSASYASIASSFFTPTRIIGTVGKDFGPEHIKRFADRG